MLKIFLITFWCHPSIITDFIESNPISTFTADIYDSILYGLRCVHISEQRMVLKHLDSQIQVGIESIVPFSDSALIAGYTIGCLKTNFCSLEPSFFTNSIPYLKELTKEFMRLSTVYPLGSTKNIALNVMSEMISIHVKFFESAELEYQSLDLRNKLIRSDNLHYRFSFLTRLIYGDGFVGLGGMVNPSYTGVEIVDHPIFGDDVQRDISSVRKYLAAHIVIRNLQLVD